FGVARVRIVYQVAPGSSEPTRQEVVNLYPREPVSAPAKHLPVSYAWDLTGLNLQPGAIVSFHIDAIDHDNVNGPNLGKGREVRLRVISKQEFGPLLEERQRELREEAQRVLEMQKQALTGVQEVERVLDQANRLENKDREQLRTAATVQR